MIGIVVGELQLAAPRIEVRFTLDISEGIRDDRGRLEVIGEIVKNTICAFASDAFATEENIFIG